MAHEKRETQRVAMPHNSMFVLGLETNKKWLHGIQPDKRIAAERSEGELAYNGIRISLTFRHIGTFLDAKESVIWGQGATAMEQRDAADVINGDEEETKRMITAFSRENHNPDFEWDEHYGSGFDVLHLHTPSADLPLLFASNDDVEDKQVQICLYEAKIPFTLVPAPTLEDLNSQVTFRDNDLHHTEITLSSSILLYIDRYHPLDTFPSSKSITAHVYTIMHLISEIRKAWVSRNVVKMENRLKVLEEQVNDLGGPFVAGSRFSFGDAFAWPVVDVLVGEWEGWDGAVYHKLDEWWRGCWRRKASVRRVKERLGEGKKGGEEEKEVGEKA
jgi:glutathione S-transferase